MPDANIEQSLQALRSSSSHSQFRMLSVLIDGFLRDAWNDATSPSVAKTLLDISAPEANPVGDLVSAFACLRPG